MQRRELEIVNRLGLHARAAAQLVKVAGAHAARVTIEKDGQSADGKSIMAVMMLAAARGSCITVTTEGRDEIAAMDAIATLVADYFGEGG
ncbi:MAG: HPr family phosphocarrier protein [Pseudomonadales bacterium]|jgi:phosphocarrier protein|nr:HPr family phosphocarrier protein [Pseudomonadales bacterium]